MFQINMLNTCRGRKILNKVFYIWDLSHNIFELLKLPKYQTRFKLNAFTCSQCMTLYGTELQNAKNQFRLKYMSSSSEVN